MTLQSNLRASYYHLAMNRQHARRATSVISPKGLRLPLANKATGEQIRTTHTPELVIALCGPIGSPLREVASTLQMLLKDEYDYECQIIRASKFISDRFPISEGGQYIERAHHLIQRGNDLREKFGNSVLAELSIRAIAIQRERRRESDQNDTPTNDAPKRFAPNRICHIIDSIKNGAELDTLRLVYGSLLHTVGVFASEQHRKRQFAAKIRDPGEIEKLIERDAKEEGVPHGQSVRSTFPLCDYFVRGDGGKSKTDAKLKRLLKLIFGIGVITPTAPETAMYQAAAAARSSACLSRQVGAAILDKNGQLIAVGWNDVPKFGGGVYTSTDETDCRCCNFRDTLCHNDAHKQCIAQEVAAALVKKKLIKRSDVEAATEVVRKSRVGSLIEFSRAVHAEMHAIILGSQLGGARMKGASLYCTTYPCHSCARHIVLAGISTVYYIEPYPKSQAIALHEDAISETDGAADKVQFLPYEGVGPSRYLEVFGVGSSKRKSDADGRLIRPQKSSALPKDSRSLESFPTLEGLVVEHLHKTGVLSQNAATDEEPA